MSKSVQTLLRGKINLARLGSQTHDAMGAKTELAAAFSGGRRLNRRGWGVAIPMSARRDRGAARQASILRHITKQSLPRKRRQQSYCCGILSSTSASALSNTSRWSVLSPRLAQTNARKADNPPRSQASESRLYTFSGESKDHLRKFRLTTSRATGPQAVICTLSFPW